MTNKIRNKVASLFLFSIFILLVFMQKCPTLSASPANQIETNIKYMKIHGKVLYENGEPVVGAEIKIGIPSSQGLSVKNNTYTDALGQYYIETPITYFYYHLLIQHDDNTTAGLDWIPVYYKIQRTNSNQNITTTLTPAATIVFDGPYSSIREYNPEMVFTILTKENNTLMIAENPLQSGYIQTYSLMLELNESTILNHLI